MAERVNAGDIEVGLLSVALATHCHNPCHLLQLHFALLGFKVLVAKQQTSQLATSMQLQSVMHRREVDVL